jgi:hypothetical protein
MSATGQYQTFSDLYTGLQQAVRITTGVTASEDQAKRAINIALQDMHLGFDYKFPWAERQSRIITQPQYITGTLTATKGSTTITGSGTLWNTNNDFGIASVRSGGKIVINGGFEVYEISTVSSDVSAVLTFKWTQDTVAGASYVYFEDEYALAADFLRPVDITKFADGGMEIELIGRTEFRRLYPKNNISGKPEVAMLIDKPFSGNATPIRKVVFWKPPSLAYTIPYSYITSNLAVSSAGVAQTQLSAATDEPIIPLRYRYGLFLHGLYNWMRDKKDDTRSQEVKSEYTDFMLRLSGDFEFGAPRPQIRPRVSEYRRRAVMPFRR